jgi:hypothetical protein
MEKQQYLPSEVVNYTNFPELRTHREDIELIQTYAKRVDLALADYEAGNYDRIDLNADELSTNVDLCRSVCDRLGTAPSVCYDVLLILREIQTTMQNVLHLKVKYGDLYVGKPTTSEGGDA